MRNILVIGAGKSASSLIKYLLDKSSAEKLHITVADVSKSAAESKINNHPNATAIALDVFNETERKNAIKKSDIVVLLVDHQLFKSIENDILHDKKIIDTRGTWS